KPSCFDSSNLPLKIEYNIFAFVDNSYLNGFLNNKIGISIKVFLSKSFIVNKLFGLDILTPPNNKRHQYIKLVSMYLFCYFKYLFFNFIYNSVPSFFFNICNIVIWFNF